jgi:hypothetical protein
MMGMSIKTNLLMATIATRNSARRFLNDQRGLTVSAVILIGILVVAVAAFGLLAADKIGEAGEQVEGVTFE